MRRFFSILVLIIFSFNIGGYYLFFRILQFNAQQNLMEKLDDDQYSMDQILEVKIPMTLPYPTYSKEFSRVDGRIEYNGTVYKLVKQKLDSDTLHIIYYEDQAEKQLISKFKEFAKKANDVPGSGKKQSEQLIKQFNKEYQSRLPEFLNDRAGIDITQSMLSGLLIIPASEFEVLTPPPQATAC